MNNNSKLPPSKLIKAYSAEAQAFAGFAYNCCVGWFGPPPDPHWPIEIDVFSTSGCSRVWFLRRYWIIIAEQLDTIEQQYHAIAHEMYHRTCSYHHSFLRRNIWIDEAMAFLTSQRILEEGGYKEHATTYARSLLRPTPVDIQELRSARKKRFGPMNKRYPPNFYPAAFRLGLALNAILYWEEICPLVHCSSLEEWLETLSPGSRFSARHLLMQPHEDLLAGFSALTDTEGPRVDILLNLGFAYEILEHLQTAEVLFREAVRLRPDHPVPYCDLGTVLSTQNKHQEAVVVKRKAIELGANEAKNYYNLGLSLLEIGQIEEARKAWEEALVRGEGRVAANAKQALEDNPL